MPKPARRPRQGRHSAGSPAGSDVTTMLGGVVTYTARAVMHERWAIVLDAFGKGSRPAAEHVISEVLDEVARTTPMSDAQRAAVMADNLPRLLATIEDAARRSVREGAAWRGRAAQMRRRADRGGGLL